MVSDADSLTSFPGQIVVLREHLTPPSSDGKYLAFFGVNKSFIAHRLSSLDVLVDPVSAQRRQDSPEEATVGPTIFVHVIIWQVFAELDVVAYKVPHVRDGIFRK